MRTPRMWHVTLTIAGESQEPTAVRAALERLVFERPFLLSGRYRPDRVELTYWEEAKYVIDAASLALRLWDEHRESAALPRWEVIGLEVLDQATFHARMRDGTAPGSGLADGSLRPY